MQPTIIPLHFIVILGALILGGIFLYLRREKKTDAALLASLAANPALANSPAFQALLAARIAPAAIPAASASAVAAKRFHLDKGLKIVLILAVVGALAYFVSLFLQGRVVGPTTNAPLITKQTLETSYVVIGALILLGVACYLGSDKKRGIKSAIGGLLLFGTIILFGYELVINDGDVHRTWNSILRTNPEDSIPGSPSSRARIATRGLNVICDSEWRTYRADQGELPLANTMRCGGTVKVDSGQIIPEYEYCVDPDGSLQHCRPDPQIDNRPRKRTKGTAVGVNDTFKPQAITQFYAVDSNSVLSVRLNPQPRRN